MSLGRLGADGALRRLAEEVLQIEDLDARLTALVGRLSWDALDESVLREKLLRHTADRGRTLDPDTWLAMLASAAFPEDEADVWASLVLTVDDR